MTKIKATNEKYFGPDVKGKALEDAAITTLKTLVFASENRTTIFIQPSGVWGNEMGMAVNDTWKGAIWDVVGLSFFGTRAALPIMPMVHTPPCST